MAVLLYGSPCSGKTVRSPTLRKFCRLLDFSPSTAGQTSAKCPVQFPLRPDEDDARTAVICCHSNSKAERAKQLKNINRLQKVSGPVRRCTNQHEELHWNGSFLARLLLL